MKRGRQKQGQRRESLTVFRDNQEGPQERATLEGDLEE